MLVNPRASAGQMDLVRMNWRCAEGLVQIEALDLTNALARLDEWAGRVRSETQRHLPRFRKQPREFNGSEGYFRMLCLVTVLQQDCGVRYNPDRLKPPDGAIESSESFFADAKDIFLHGLLGKERMGTCSSMPVLYVAIGRRLTYPLKLVTTKNHLFVRWEDERERFNVEATSEGLVCFEDDYYRQWPFPVTPEEEREEGYLKSLTPSEELAVFLSLRAQCLRAAKRFEEALEAQKQVCRLMPQSKVELKVLERLRHEIEEKATATEPSRQTNKRQDNENPQ